jgi:hypothetical protein
VVKQLWKPGIFNQPSNFVIFLFDEGHVRRDRGDHAGFFHVQISRPDEGIG